MVACCIIGKSPRLQVLRVSSMGFVCQRTHYQIINSRHPHNRYLMPKGILGHMVGCLFPRP